MIAVKNLYELADEYMQEAYSSAGIELIVKLSELRGCEMSAKSGPYAILISRLRDDSGAYATNVYGEDYNMCHCDAKWVGWRVLVIDH